LAGAGTAYPTPAAEQHNTPTATTFLSSSASFSEYRCCCPEPVLATTDDRCFPFSIKDYDNGAKKGQKRRKRRKKRTAYRQRSA
jgi:hypothetical protein